MTNSAPDRCPTCDVPTRLSANGKVPGMRDEAMAQTPVHYCPRCKTTWLITPH